MKTVFVQKKENAVKIKKNLWLMQKYKPLWLIKLTNSAVLKDLSECLKSLPAGFVIQTEWVNTEILASNVVITWNIDNSMISWFDFLVCDDEINNLNTYMEKWITPLICRENHISKLLSEFDPLKNEWNSYLYDNWNKYSIFYSIIRYMENYKFPFDNKNLVNNVLKL